MKDKEVTMQFEPEIFKNHHHKHIVDYNGKYKRCNGTNYFGGDLRRSKSSDRTSNSTGSNIIVNRHIHHHNHNSNNNNIVSKKSLSSKDSSSSLNGSTIISYDDGTDDISSFDDNRGNFNLNKPKKGQPVIVYVGDGRSRVRRVVSQQTRHVTVVSYSTRHKETRSHTSHHVTTVR